MAPDKILSVIEMYEKQLVARGIPKVRTDAGNYFRDLTSEQLLAHAHYLCDGIKEFAKDATLQRKTGSHLAAIQMCLSFAGWYTLGELMDHNRPAQSTGNRGFVRGISDFMEPEWSRSSTPA